MRALVVATLFALSFAVHPFDDLPAASSCTGSGDPKKGACYSGSKGVGPLQETVHIKVDSFSEEKGTADVSGSGVKKFSCKKKSFKKSGSKISIDTNGCLPSGATLKEVKYCHHENTLQVTVDFKGHSATIVGKHASCASNHDDSDPHLEAFFDFMTQFSNQSMDEQEIQARYANFKANYIRIEGENANGTDPSVSYEANANGVDCSKAACQKTCECANSKCAKSIATCLADEKCAKGQSCIFKCKCGDKKCALKCAAEDPSPKAIPVASCLKSHCLSDESIVV